MNNFFLLEPAPLHEHLLNSSFIWCEETTEVRLTVLPSSCLPDLKLHSGTGSLFLGTLCAGCFHKETQSIFPAGRCLSPLTLVQCHSVLGLRTEGIAQLANLTDLMESSPCRLYQVCTLLPSVCLIGGNHWFPPPPVQSLLFLVTAASSPALHPSDHSWSPHTGGHGLLSVERAHSLLPLPPYFSFRLPCLLLDFCFLTFPVNCIIPCPSYFTEHSNNLLSWVLFFF